MKVYFACSISGGRRDQVIYEEFVGYIESLGHTVLNSIISRNDILLNDGKITAREIFNRDTGWIDESDVLIAEVGTPSHGVGFEIAYALSNNKPVFCCYTKDRVISKMILGNPHHLLKICKYETVDELKKAINQFLM